MYRNITILGLIKEPSKTWARTSKKLGLMVVLGWRIFGPQAVRWYKALNNSVHFFVGNTF